MINLINSFKITTTSLAIFMAVPFIFFIFYSRVWYLPKKAEIVNFLFKIICILLSAVIIIKCAFSYSSLSKNALILLALHLAPILLTFLIANYQRRIAMLVARQLEMAPSNPMVIGSAPSPNYMPAPINNSIENLSWNDLVISEELKTELKSVAELLKNPQEAARYGIVLPKGILFTGAPGTGKTTIAKVMANEAGLNFFVLSMDDIASKYVGEAEKNLTKLFLSARKHAPAIIFIDEVDSIGRGRGDHTEAWSDNLLNHLLQLIDGVISIQGLYIIAATNRDDLVDSALKRAGRLNKVIQIPLPDQEAREKLFYLYLSRLPLATKIDLPTLARIANGKSGADIKAICQQAGLNAFKREAGSKHKNYSVTPQDIEMALREFMRQ